MTAKKKANGFMRYTTYNFIDKDPVIDVNRTAKANAGMTDQEIAAASKVSVNTIKAHFGGKTRRPQFATIAAIAAACGLESLPITPSGRARFKQHGK